MEHSMPRAIDHLVLAGHDLDALAALYRRLGFNVGPRNKHPWGTENHIVQLAGGFLELIGLGAGFHAPAATEPVAPFAGFLAHYLAQREGLAMLALRAANAAADADEFAHVKIGFGAPFSFSRAATRADGSAAPVAFTLAFARSALIPDAGFFTCQQHNPENFRDAAAQAHPNGASHVASVVMVAENPSAHAEFLSHFCGEREMLATSMGIDIDTGGGHIEVLTPLAFQFRFGAPALPADAGDTPRFAAYRIAVANIDAARASLAAQGVVAGMHDGRIVVPPAAAHGVAIVFEAATP